MSFLSSDWLGQLSVAVVVLSVAVVLISVAVVLVSVAIAAPYFSRLNGTKLFFQIRDQSIRNQVNYTININPSNALDRVYTQR